MTLLIYNYKHCQHLYQSTDVTSCNTEYQDYFFLFFQDYIGGEDEVGLPVVTSPKRKRKGAFISGTVDIDILLGKETAPTNLGPIL